MDQKSDVGDRLAADPSVRDALDYARGCVDEMLAVSAGHGVLREVRRKLLRVRVQIEIELQKRDSRR